MMNMMIIKNCAQAVHSKNNLSFNEYQLNVKYIDTIYSLNISYLAIYYNHY